MLFIDMIYFLVSGQFAIVSYPDKFIVILKISQLMNDNFLLSAGHEYEMI